MQGRDDVAGFIAGFAGDDRYIVDYLVEEVLQRQPEQVRSFLLQTSILDRLSGPLCDAVTGQDGGKAMLEALERGNLFLVPLDDRRQWYRYHHLFADVLRAHLLDEQPDRVAGAAPAGERLVRAATASRSEAIRHALAGEDFERAADLVELAIPATAPGPAGGHAARLARGAARRAGPGQARAQRRRTPATLLVSGELEGVEARLRDAERWLDATRRHARGLDAPATDMVVVDDEAVPPPAGGDRRLPGRRWPWRAATCAGTVTHARRALDARRRGRSPRARRRQRDCSGSRTGRAGTSRPRTGAYADVRGEPAAGRARLRRPRVRASRWPTSGSRRVASARRCAPTSEALQRATGQGAAGAARERRTCTWA